MKPITPRMLQVLRWIAEGKPSGHGCKTMSDHGGRHATLFALIRRGLLTPDHKITATGIHVANRPSPHPCGSAV